MSMMVGRGSAIRGLFGVRGILALAGILLASPVDCLRAQASAFLTVRVIAPDGSWIEGARVSLSNPRTGFEKPLLPRGPGEYILADIPLQDYRLAVEASGFRSGLREVSLRTGIPVSVEIRLALEIAQQRVDVSAMATPQLVDTTATGTRAALSLESLRNIPVAPTGRGLETYLLSFPGFAANANGAIHPRGAHNQMTFLVDGMPINDQLTGAFATALDPGIVDNLELFTGDIPAEFGAKVSGVAVVSTRSGLNSGRRSFGSVELMGGGFDTLQTSAQAGGNAGAFAYYGGFSTTKTHRFLDAVSLDNQHNGGNAERAFVRLDYQLSDRDWVRWSAMAGRSSFELANLRSQQAAGMDQRQLLRDLSMWVRWNHILGPSATWDSTVAYRPTVSLLIPSLNDRPVTASQTRHLTTVTSANRLNWIVGAHSLRIGADLQHFPVSEQFQMGITDSLFNAPGSARFNESLLPFDLSRGGRLFRFSDANSGSLYSAFLQDSLNAGRFTLSLGLRYDSYRFLVHGAQWQSRVGVAFHLRETGTVFRASYNRNYQTPPNENLLLSDSEEASRLAPASVREALGQARVSIRPQRENVYETGLQQSLFGSASLDVSFYHKDSVDQQDNNNFFDTGIIFPLTLARIRVNGLEGRLNLPEWRGLLGTLSLTHSHSVSTPPFTGGLYIGQDAVDLLSAGPFVIDHDQKLGVQGNLHYAPARAWSVSGSVRYDSGLVSNPSDPAQVAGDPDYFDLLPYVDLGADPPRVRPRTVVDLAMAYSFWRGDRKAWEAQLQFTNLFDKAGLYSFQSVFVGTRLIAPRTASLKLRWYW